MKYLKYILVVGTLCLTDCAYFNTFYNAKQYYRKALHATRKNRTGKVVGPEKTNYQKAIEKSSKLIEMYPNSKYVDDALLMMGKCYYYIEEYLNARRRLEELRTDYPDSELILEANLWLAKTDLALEQYDEARVGLEAFFSSEVPKKLRGEAYFYYGRLHQEQKFFETAVDAYQKSIEADVGDLKAEALYVIGVNYDSLGMYDKASEFYHEVVKADPVLELHFEAEFKYAQMIKKLGRYDESISLYERLLGEERYKTWFPELQLEVAACLALKGDIDGAMIAYQDIILEYKKTIHSARAYYMLGQLYEEQQYDYDRAQDAYAQVQREFRQSSVGDSAETRRRDIQRFQALKRVIQMVQRGEEGELVVVKEETQEDTLANDAIYAMIDSASVDSLRQQLLIKMAGQAFVDSIMSDYAYQQYGRTGSANQDVGSRDAYRDRRSREIPGRQDEDTPRMDWIEWIEDGDYPGEVDLVVELRKLYDRRRELEKRRIAENPDLKSFRPEELDKNLLLLAELYLFRFNQPDSAFDQYQRLLSQFPDSPYAPQAVYNLSHVACEITGNTEEQARYLRMLIQNYPQSEFSNIAREHLGLTPVLAGEDSIQTLFREAETWLLERDNPTAAFKKYSQIWESFPETDMAPKAMYSMAWVGETYLDSLSLAFVLYDSLVKLYPETVYAKKVKKKVDAYVAEQKKRAEAASRTESADSTVVDTLSTMGRTPEEIGTEILDTLPTDSSTVELSAVDSSVVVDTSAVDLSVTDTSAVDLSVVDTSATTPEVVGEVKQPASPVGGIEAIQDRIIALPNLDMRNLKKEIRIRVNIDEEGKVVRWDIVESTNNRAVDGAVIEVIRSSPFQPATGDSGPVSSWITLTIPLTKE